MTYSLNEYSFHYAHLLPQKPPIGICPPEHTITCKACREPVSTTARNRKRCTACAEKRKRALVDRRDEQRRRERKRPAAIAQAKPSAQD